MDDVPARCGALRQAESLWFKERFSREEAEKEWSEKSQQAYNLRNQLLHDFRFAYRKDSDLAGSVSQIAEGSGHADKMRHLSDLAVVGKDHPGSASDISFNRVQNYIFLCLLSHSNHDVARLRVK